ncbi:MAG: AAA family ATPase [Clostridia bacterium]|nr:AAA family ATPase [Clostridia bacterium]
MLIESGLFVKDDDKNLVVSNQFMVDFILSAYASEAYGDESDPSTGFVSKFPMPVLNTKLVKRNAPIEAKTIVAYLFDGIDEEIVNRFICPQGTTIENMIRNFGLSTDCKGKFIQYKGYEHLVAEKWITSTDPLVQELATIILQIRKGLVAPNDICESIDDTEDDSLNPSVEAELTPEWFKAHADEFEDVRIEAEIQYDDFQSKFAPEVLAALSGEDLLRKMFYSGDSNKENLCYYLEFHTKVRELFGSVAGGSAFKFNLFYQKKKSSWVTGSAGKPKLLTVDEAIILGTEIRDALVKGAKIIEANKDVSDAEGYNRLYTQLFAAMGKYINLLWVQKYYHMIFPNMFPVFYNETWQRHVLTKLDIEPYDSGFVRMGQISLFVEKCDIENVVFAQIIYKYFNMVEEEGSEETDPNDSTEEAEEENMEEVRPFIELNFTTNIDCDFERNRIVFGAPGTGKSYQMEEDRATLVKMGGGYERVTFHPDYTYSSFVGCYKPVSEKGEIKYKYVPGPFMRVLVEALRSGLTDNPKPYLLLIEEINRAKVAAVFGEVFQLLDRDSNGTSDYEIHTSEDVKKYLSDELKGSLDSFARIRIPNNMFIWASMNSADQGVFPMDTAFKRRWSFEYKGIDENEDKVGGTIVLGKNESAFEVNWNTLRKAINATLATKFGINEDKLMGPFFIGEDVFAFGDDGKILNPTKFIKVFKSKVIMYLYEDAAKQQKHKLFSGCDSTRYSSICDAFDETGIEIFGAEFKNTYNDLR